MTAVLVMLGGAFGASARYLIDHWIQSLHSRDWPWGTLIINWTGSFALGAMSGATPTLASLVSVGFIGAFTTWSTFMVETVRLHSEDGWKKSASYLALSLAGGIALAFCGHALSA